MNRKHVVGGILFVVLLFIGLGTAFYLGVGPAPGSGSGDTIDEFPTGTEYDEESDGDADVPPFSFTVQEIEECGQTCRDVTAAVENNQNETASEVTVYTRIFAGEDSTDTDDLVWEGTEDVGTLDSGASHTTTQRVELTLQEARKIDQHDGWITIVTTVESNEETVTFTDSEQVS